MRYIKCAKCKNYVPNVMTATCCDCDSICNYEEKLPTNADHIRSMSDEELSEFIRSMVDESNSHNVACYGCINYGTHHSDPANKGTPLYECEGCTNEGIGLDVLMWLQQPSEEEQK